MKKISLGYLQISENINAIYLRLTLECLVAAKNNMCWIIVAL